MASSDSQIDKPQRGRPKGAELPEVNISTDAQIINTKRAFLNLLVVELPLCLFIVLFIYLFFAFIILPERKVSHSQKTSTEF